MPSRKVLLAVGSPRGERSTSWSLGQFLAERLRDRDWTADHIILPRLTLTGEGIESLLGLVRGTDLVVLCTPLYIDALPGPVVQVFEVIRDLSPESRGWNGTPFIAIVNQGFPESFQSRLALRIAELMAGSCGFTWAGGLALGMGGVINGTPLADVGWVARKARSALEITAKALSSGQPVPTEAIRLMGEPAIPPWLYLLIADRSWKKESARNHVSDRLFDSPYADPP